VGAVYHIFVSEGGSWRRIATLPEPPTEDAARQIVEHLQSGAVGAPVRMIREENATVPPDPGNPGARGET
jgi:hypothetical protein